MAISKVYINGDLTALQAFLSASGLFDSVTLDGTTVICKDADDNTLVTFNKPSGTATVTIYASAAVSQAVTHDSSPFQYGYSCANGILLASAVTSSNYTMYILITKTNNNKVVTVANSSRGYASSFYAIAWGDVAPLSSMSFARNTKNQTCITPFISDADMDAVSYTPNAGYMTAFQNSGMGYGKFTFDGAIWLTNGYWAIKDE